jgi:hypothetical protein
MAMSYKVRRKGFEVRWTVNGHEKSESFLTKGLAESRRAKLVTAARDGEPFGTQTGLPASEIRARKQRTTWYVLAREYIEQRWDRTPRNTRRTLADALATTTPAFVEPGARTGLLECCGEHCTRGPSTRMHGRPIRQKSGRQHWTGCSATRYL